MQSHISRTHLRIIVLAVAALALSLLLSAAASSRPADAQTDSVAAMTIDANPAGNTARSVGPVDNCVSASVGQSVEIDIVLPGPGVPADRGISAYQFTLGYNPRLLWVTGDDFHQLLTQAPKSNPVTIADPKPDKNGNYVSWVIDFGQPYSIEPAGTSEIGPGVLSRLTIQPIANGTSLLNLTDVQILDANNQRITIGSIGTANIYIGATCPGQTASSNPTPAPATAPSSQSPASAPASGTTSAPPPAAGSARQTAATTRQGSSSSATGPDAPASLTPSGVARSGGAPSPVRPSWLFLAAGLVLLLVSAPLVLAGLAADRRA